MWYIIPNIDSYLAAIPMGYRWVGFAIFMVAMTAIAAIMILCSYNKNEKSADVLHTSAQCEDDYYFGKKVVIPEPRKDLF